jgi:cell division protein FtsB
MINNEEIHMLSSESNDFNNKYVSKLRDLESKLYSEQLQEKFNKVANNQEQKKFIQTRIDLSTNISELESQAIDKIADKLQKNESALRQGIASLSATIDRLASSIETLQGMATLIGTISRIIA